MDKITRNLACELTIAEKIERGELMGQLSQELQDVEAEKAASAAHYNERLKRIRIRLGETGRELRTGQTFRDVECERVEIWPEKAVQTIRLDTGEQIDKRPMTPAELQRELDLEAGEEVTGDGTGEALPPIAPEDDPTMPPPAGEPPEDLEGLDEVRKVAAEEKLEELETRGPAGAEAGDKLQETLAEAPPDADVAPSPGPTEGEDPDGPFALTEEEKAAEAEALARPGKHGKVKGRKKASSKRRQGRLVDPPGGGDDPFA